MQCGILHSTTGFPSPCWRMQHGGLLLPTPTPSRDIFHVINSSFCDMLNNLARKNIIVALVVGQLLFYGLKVDAPPPGARWATPQSPEHLNYLKSDIFG